MLIDRKKLKIFLPEWIYQICDIDDLYIKENLTTEDSMFSSEYFIFMLIVNPKNIELKENKKTLDKLCKKIDVQKNIAKTYSKDLSKTIDNTAIDKESLVLLMILYLNVVQQDRNIKFLNTVLKTLDGIIASKYKYPNFLHIWADRLVEELI